MPESCSPEANYLTRNNIVHPLSQATNAAAVIAAAEARGRARIADLTGLAPTGGSIKRGVS